MSVCRKSVSQDIPKNENNIGVIGSEQSVMLQIINDNVAHVLLSLTVPLAT